MSFPKKGRNFRTESGKTFPKSSDKISNLNDDEFTVAISQALHKAYGGKLSSAKAVMKHTGASERTVKNWFQGKNSPNGENLVRLMRHSDEILETLLVMAGREDILAGKLLFGVYAKLVEMMEIIEQSIDHNAVD